MQGTPGTTSSTYYLDFHCVICIPFAASCYDYSDYVSGAPAPHFTFSYAMHFGRLFGGSNVGRGVTFVGGELEFPQG